MSEMIPFRYSGYWDVPRYILLKDRDKWLFLCSGFDEALDEFSEIYAVYRVPASVAPRLEDENLVILYNMMLEGLLECVGTINVQDVKFDESNRKTLDPRCFDSLVKLQ